MKLVELLKEIRNLEYEDLVVLVTESNHLMQVKYLLKAHSEHAVKRSSNLKEELSEAGDRRDWDECDRIEEKLTKEISTIRKLDAIKEIKDSNKSKKWG
jgi:hypothetical protein